MSVSMGIDLVASGLGAMGVNLMDTVFISATFIWEIAATVIAISRLHASDTGGDSGRKTINAA